MWSKSCTLSLHRSYVIITIKKKQGNGTLNATIKLFSLPGNGWEMIWFFTTMCGICDLICTASRDSCANISLHNRTFCATSSLDCQCAVPVNNVQIESYSEWCKVYLSRHTQEHNYFKLISLIMENTCHLQNPL